MVVRRLAMAQMRVRFPLPAPLDIYIKKIYYSLMSDLPPTDEERWEDLTLQQNFGAINLQNYLGGVVSGLPENKRPTDGIEQLLRSTKKGVLAYAAKVVQDDESWSSLPENIIIKGLSYARGDLREKISKLVTRFEKS